MDISLSIQKLYVKKESKVSSSEFYDLWEKVSCEFKKYECTYFFSTLSIKINTLNYNYHAAELN